MDRRTNTICFTMVTTLLLIGACAETKLAVHSAKRVILAIEEKPQARYKVGNPYQIAGTWYYPKEDYEYDETGIASWYGRKFHGRKTANGEIYDMNALTAAHRTLPMPSYVQVTNLDNGRSLVLKVNDRGPFAKGRIIDISRRGAQLLKFQKEGTAKVHVKILAAKSRSAAFRMQNKEEIAKVGSPITIKKLPKAKVSAEALAPTGGFPALQQAPASRQLLAPSSSALVPKTAKVGNVDEPLTGKITQNLVESSKIYVQAGAFSEYLNANRVQARLSSIGSVEISNVLVNGRDLYRVRIGPLSNVAAADQLLEVVANAGYNSARIVVE